MSNLNNPAGRLRNWLDRARHETKQEEAALDGWGQLFDVDYDNPRGRVSVIGRGAALMDLATETRALMGTLPPELHANALMADFGEVETCLGNFMNVGRITMQKFLEPILATGWRSLEYADLYLATHRGERWISDTTQEDLLSKVREVIDATIASEDLTDGARRMVLRRLRQVEDAILDCRLRGVESIEETADSLIGGILRRTDMTIEFFKTPTGMLIGGLVVLLLRSLDLESGFLELLSGSPGDAATIDPGVDLNGTTTEIEGDVVDGVIVEDEAPHEK